MRVLLVAMKHDYGDPHRGASGMDEYFLQPLRRMGCNVVEFDFVQRHHEEGCAGMNANLLQVVRESRPDITLFVPFRDEFIPEVIDQISELTVTVAYFFDDVWRVDYSRFWSRHFSFVTTSDYEGVARWKLRGCYNFLYSPFAVNCEVFRKRTLPWRYDVSFVGAHHPYREWVMERLNLAGIRVNAWGYGWPSGRLSVLDMVATFNQSKINLNMSNNEHHGIRYLLAGGRRWRQIQQVWKGAARALLRRDAKTVEMVKGRHFEINACGAFQLSYMVGGLDVYYAIGKELDVYADVDDMIEKIHYYLEREQDRAAVAHAGLVRTLSCHRAEQRFTELFNAVRARKLMVGSREKGATI